MDPNIIIFCSLIGTLIIIAIINTILNKVYEKRVIQSSELLKELKNLNKSYNFNLNVSPTYSYKKSCNYKYQYDNFNCNSYILEKIEENINFFYNLIDKIEFNIDTHGRYYIDYLKLTSKVTKEDTKKFKVPFKKYVEIEKKHFEKNKLKPPLSTSLLIITPHKKNLQ